MIRVWDGFLSLVGAIVTAVAVGAPLFAAFQAVRADLVALWVWGPMVILAIVGVVMVSAFLRKAVRGVHPLRDRRR